MKLIKEGELCMLRNYIVHTLESGDMRPELQDTGEDMIKIIDHTLNNETINTVPDRVERF